MEALVILLAEFILAPVTAAITIGIEGILSVLSLIAEPLFGITLTRFKHGKKDEHRKYKSSKKYFRWIQIILISIFGIFIVTVIVLNQFFFEPTLKWGLKRIERETGIQAEFASASGNIFTGRFELTGTDLHRQGDKISNFDINIARLIIDLSMTDIFSTPVIIKEVVIAGLKGEYEEVVPAGLKGEYGQAGTADKIKERKRYRVQHFQIKDVDITVNKPIQTNKKINLNLVINKLDSQPLRSHLAVFDIFFRSNISGSLNGHPFLIKTEELSEGRQTQWEVTSLPIHSLAKQIGGYFSWISSGTIDLRVKDYWKLDDKTEIDMQWELLMKDITAKVPENLALIKRPFANAIVEYINKNGEKIDLSFGFVMNEKQFEGSASLQAAGLWKVVSRSIAKELAKQSRRDPELLNQQIKTGIRLFQEYLDKKRKGSE